MRERERKIIIIKEIVKFTLNIIIHRKWEFVFHRKWDFLWTHLSKYTKDVMNIHPDFKSDHPIYILS